MTNVNLILDIGKLSEPATVLIEKISDAITGYFRPHQIRRVAQAEADADIIKAQAEIDITDLERRALRRFLKEEARKHDNIEQIIRKALPYLTETAKPKEMNNDWISNFFDKCKIISDEEMQSLWSKVLAGEANSPGKYSKRTVNMLNSLDREEADLFTSLCGFGWFLGDVVPLIFDLQHSIYNERGINFNAMTHLDDIGLVSFNDIAGYKRMKLPKKVKIFYYGSPLLIEFPNEADNEIEIGRVLLTATGQELAPISGSKPVAGFFEYVTERFKPKGWIISLPESGSKLKKQQGGVADFT